MSTSPDTESEQTDEFIDQYNKELDEANSEIEVGNYLSHEEVVLLFQQRRSAR